MSTKHAILAVAVLAGAAHMANAEIVYRPLSIVIQGGGNPGTPGTQPTGGFAYEYVDFDLDGSPELQFAGEDIVVVGNLIFSNAYVSTLGNTRIVFDNTEPAALVDGEVIGPGSDFGSGNLALLYDLWNGIDTGFSTGPFPRYFGVEFVMAGQVHYGWVRMSDSEGINGLAYETTPGMSIAAGAIPAPGAAALLCVASPFLARRRR